MDLYKEMLIHILSKEKVKVAFPELSICSRELIEQESYKALCKIKSILEDDTLNDVDCFEKLGSSSGGRHDF